MAYCSDCFNGCGDKLTTDQCVRYTGSTISELDITNGDTLLTVINSLTDYLISVISGEGIILDIDPDDICDLVKDYLEDTNPITALDLFQALYKAACDLQEQVDVEKARIDVIEANYTVSCLDDVSTGDGTHTILQAVITKLCQIDTDLIALALDLDTNYVKLADLNALIQAYLDSIDITDKAYTKMVPYVAQEYYGPTSNYPETGDSFDVNGVGSGYWENVYLCNGYNGLTPDKRGRVAVGAIVGMAGGALDPEVDPAVDPTFNPNYTLNDTTGNNSVTLDATEMPVHTHTVNETAHTHIIAKDQVVGAGNPLTTGSYLASNLTTLPSSQDYTLSDATGDPDVGIVGESLTNITLNNAGASAAHDNKQPVIAAYYIMFVPS